MADPFDLDAFIAEEEGELFTFVFDGEVYSMPSNMDIRAVSDASTGNLEAAFVRMLGVDQWAQLKAADGVLSATALQALFVAYAQHSGLDVPNSSASTSSSLSMGGRSKPISNGRTTSRSRTSSRAS